MLLLDVLIRYSAVGLLLLLAALAMRDARRVRPAIYAVLVCVSVAALLLSTAPEAVRFPDPFQSILRILDGPNVGFIWWFGLSLFNDDFKLRRLEWIGFSLYTVPVLAYRFNEIGLIGDLPYTTETVINTVSMAMMVHLAWTAWAGRGDDMVEMRRRVRLWFVLALALVAAVVLQAENFLYPAYDHELSIARAAVALIMVLWGLFWLVKLQSEHLAFESAAISVPIQPSIDPRDRMLHQRLIGLMEGEKAYAEQGLTIDRLAETLEVPEHQLRALINKGMGHRNFSAFVNGYRIEAAKELLSDPGKARVQILTIAMDTGFGSLAPFNRAFKAAEGITPTQFRQRALTLSE